MTLPSFDTSWLCGAAIKPRILVLEVMDRLGKTKDPVVHIAVERDDSIEKDPSGTVTRARLTLNYRVIDEDGNAGESQGGSFCGSYCSTSQSISLTSLNLMSGAVFLDPPYIQGHRVGTYLMNEIVAWAKQWPLARVNSIILNASQADKDNKLRRNRFYEQFNLTFEYTDDNREAGSSLTIPASELMTVTTWGENIREWPVHQFIGHLLLQRRQVELNQWSLRRAFDDLLAETRRAEKSPLWWGIKQWCTSHVQGVVWGVIAVAIAGTTYLKLY